MELYRWSEWRTPRGGSKSRFGARKWRTSQLICSFFLRTTGELELRLSGTWAQDICLIGGMIGGVIRVIGVVGMEDAQGWVVNRVSEP